MPKLIQIGNVYGIRKRVPHDILRTFDKTRTGKPKEDLWLPISKNREEAKRNIPHAEIKAQDLFDAHRRERGIGTTLVAVEPVRQTPQQACAAFFLTLQERERARRQQLVEDAKAQPAMFWAGELIDLPAVKNRDSEGFHGVVGKALAMDVARRLANAKGALAVMDMQKVRQSSSETDESLLPLLARTEIAFLEAVLRDAGVLFGSMPPLGTVRLGNPVPFALHAALSGPDPLFSEMADDWFKMRVGSSGKDWSMERQNTLSNGSEGLTRIGVEELTTL